MKKIILFILTVVSLTSCNDASELYNYPENKIGFLFKKLESKEFVKSFTYDPSTVKRDTIYLPMRTMGFVPDEDRPIQVEQVQVTEEEFPDVQNAVPGVHYVPLDDADWKKIAVAKGGNSVVNLPIILLRDASLANGKYALKLRIVENDVFKIVNPELGTRVVLFSDQLLKPANWDATFVKNYGVWGGVKHRFMIDITNNKWDEEFIAEVMNDGSYNLFLRKFMGAELAKENARRAVAGEGPLREVGLGGAAGPLVIFPY